MTSIYENDELIGTLTRALIKITGSRIFQFHRFGKTDQEHVERLLEFFNPGTDEVIADVGGGVGGVSEIMYQLRPDLRFILINPGIEQLRLASDEFIKIEGRAENLPLADNSVDMIMACYVMGHIDRLQFARECWHILLRHQHVCVYDIFVDDLDKPCRLAEDLDYDEMWIPEIIATFRGAEFGHVATIETTFLPENFAAILPRPDSLVNTKSAAMIFSRL